MHHTGALGMSKVIQRYVSRQVGNRSFDIAYVDGGELVSPALLKDLKPRCGVLVSYNIDDPFGKRDHGKWRLYLQSLPLYDLTVVIRECNVQEALDAGARKVLHVYRAADEVAHAPRILTESECETWASSVVFVGTWMPERSPFLAALAQWGVRPLAKGERVAGSQPALERTWFIRRR